MPTTYKDQFFRIDPGNAPARGTTLNVERAEFVDSNDNGQINSNAGDTFQGIIVTSVWVNDTVTIDVPGVGRITYRGTTLYLANGDGAVFTPNDGQALQNGTFVRSSFVFSSTQMPVGTFGPTCFTAGARIAVSKGTRLVEDIVVGDLIETLDDGLQPVRMVLRQTVRAYGKFAPIRFEAGSIGNDSVLMVSPQHRMMVDDWRAQLVLGCDEVLVAAKHLVNGTTVSIVEGGVVEYIHLLFDRHQIIFANGCASESCLPDTGLSQQDQEHEGELLELFPELAKLESRITAARTVVHAGEAACLLAA